MGALPNKFGTHKWTIRKILWGKVFVTRTDGNTTELRFRKSLLKKFRIFDFLNYSLTEGEEIVSGASPVAPKRDGDPVHESLRTKSMSERIQQVMLLKAQGYAKIEELTEKLRVARSRVEQLEEEHVRLLDTM